MGRRRACHRSTEPGAAGRVQRLARGAARLAARLVLMGAALVSGAILAEAQLKREQLTIVTAAGSHTIDVEVAETAEEKARGLMFRTSVPERTGMLFPYPSAQEITMWMRNTYVSLDMVFIRADGLVHRIEERTEPLSERIIASGGPVTGVLELAAGSAERLQLKRGDRIVHPHFKADATRRR